MSDRGATVTSSFFSELCSSLGVQQTLFTAFHPQTDGQTERVNQTLEQYLRIYCKYLQHEWRRLLPLAECSYNNAESASTGITPFFANKGYHLRFQATLLQPSQSAANGMVKNLNAVHNECREAMAKAQETFKTYADRKRLPALSFQPGDMVRLRRFNIKTT